MSHFTDYATTPYFLTVYTGTTTRLIRHNATATPSVQKAKGDLANSGLRFVFCRPGQRPGRMPGLPNRRPGILRSSPQGFRFSCGVVSLRRGAESATTPQVKDSAGRNPLGERAGVFPSVPYRLSTVTYASVRCVGRSSNPMRKTARFKGRIWLSFEVARPRPTQREKGARRLRSLDRNRPTEGERLLGGRARERLERRAGMRTAKANERTRRSMMRSESYSYSCLTTSDSFCWRSFA